MAKRWVLCKMGDFENTGDTVPKLNLYGANSRVWTGSREWAFGQVGYDNIAELSLDPDIYVLPDAPMDMSIGSIPVAVRAEMKAAAESAGLEFSAVKTTWTYRSMLNYLAGQIQSGADVELGDVQDMPSI